MDSTFTTAPPELRTIRLLLRSFGREDVPALVRLAGAKEIAATTLQIPHPYAEHDAWSFLAKASEDFRAGQSISFAISISPGRELCGAVGLHIADAHRRAELGYWIGVPFWNKGFATEAASAAVAFGFQELRLHRIYAHHFSGNTRSQHVLEKIGMRHEGPSRAHIQKWDRFVDLENYGLLAEEFSQRRVKT
ncbi:MAG TPA: GNAT family protein [Candidatus Acidoferrales bacterium]|jgi:RimJ/RimL family protein N-acetyltransferase|nr:GNAT family protein [Candidatus Acidoferrales bacterium]